MSVRKPLKKNPSLRRYDSQSSEDCLSQSGSEVTPPEPSDSISQIELYNLAVKFLYGFGLLFIAYIFGYFGLSFAWLLLGLITWLLRFKYLQEQDIQVNIQRAVGANEKLAITAALKHLPSWVYFPDTERAEWINRILKQMWPFIDSYVKELLKNTIEPSICSSLPDYLKSFRFEKVDIGTVPFRVGGVKCYDEHTSRKEIIMDLELIYAGNCDIQVRVKGLKAGIRDVQLYGTLRVVMRPLLKEVPIVGGLSFFFLNNPFIEFNLTNLADVLDIPGISDILRRAISEQLAAYLVLPNKITVPLVDNLSMKALKFVQPVGVVRLEIIEAKELRKADVGMLGLGKSDPYCNVTIGTQDYRTPTITNTINPKWHFGCECLIHYLFAQSVTIEVMDEDQGSSDDFLGKTTIPLDLIVKSGVMEKWFKLEETNTGSVLIRATWLTLVENLDFIDEQLEASKKIKENYLFKKMKRDPMVPFGSVATLLIFLDSCKNLPFVTRTAGEPSSYVIFSLGDKKRQSNIKMENTNPVWEETFFFLIGDPRQELDLKAEVWDSKMKKIIGFVEFKMRDILASPHLEKNGVFPIQGKGKECSLLATVQIRLLCEPEMNGSGPSSPLQFVDELEEEVKSTESPKIMSLEQMVFATIEPILDTSETPRDMLERSQQDRTLSARRRVERSPALSEYDTPDREKVDRIPRIQVTLRRVSTLSSKLSLVIHRAIHLPGVFEHKPDSFVKITPMPQKGKDTRKKTEVRRNTSNPEFEEMFDFDPDASTPINSFDILVCVKSRSGIGSMFSKKSKIIGRTTINLSDLEDQQVLTRWYDLEHKDD